jgi:hypothetical protein
MACCSGKTVWRTEPVGRQLAEVARCTVCSAAQAVERYVLPLEPPHPESCLDCSGACVRNTCAQCGAQAAEVIGRHLHWATVHPSCDFLLAAEACLDAGRLLLGLKLATAAIRHGGSAVEAHRLRITALAALGEVTRARWEAGVRARVPESEWRDWVVLARICASLEDRDGRIRALRGALGRLEAPESLWAELAELEAQRGDGLGACAAAVKGIAAEPERCAAVLAGESDRLRREGNTRRAKQVCELAGELQRSEVDLAWLRAQLANHAAQRKVWLDVTLALRPTHLGARELAERQQGFGPFLVRLWERMGAPSPSARVDG